MHPPVSNDHSGVASSGSGGSASLAVVAAPLGLQLHMDPWKAKRVKDMCSMRVHCMGVLAVLTLA